MNSDPMLIPKDPPKLEPRLFIGGPWHGRVERIPPDTNSWRVAPPGGGDVMYHRHVIVLSSTRAISAFVLSGVTMGGAPDGWRVADAIAIALGKSVGLMVAGE